MMLIMITEKIAAKKRKQVVPGLAPGKIRVIMLTFMGLVSTKVKQLQRAQQRWHYPKHNEVWLGDPQF